MRLGLLFFLIGATSLRPQTLIDPSRARGAIRLSRSQPGENPALRSHSDPPGAQFRFPVSGGIFRSCADGAVLRPGSPLGHRYESHPGGRRPSGLLRQQLPAARRAENQESIEVGGGISWARALSGALGLD